MSKKIEIIIAEKPSMARNMQKALDCNIQKSFYLTNKDNTRILTYAFWHLFRLKYPDQINPNLKYWKLETLPIFIPFNKDNYEPIPADNSSKGTKQQIDNITNLFRENKDNDIYVYHAWDPDREGELIVRMIMNHIRIQLKEEWIDIDKSIKGEYRMWLKDFSKKTILGEYEKKRPIEDYNNFYRAAQARSHSDWLVGINLTRYYTLVSGSYWKENTLNVWRVQSAILKILVDRELEIRNFVEIIRYKILWHFSEENTFVAEWYSEKVKDWKLLNKEHVKLVEDDLKKRKEFEVIEKKKEVKKDSLKELYHLVKLQSDTEKQFKYSPTDTLQYMQNLYEKYKIMSYPRTDSGYIADEDWKRLEDTLLNWLKDIPNFSETINRFIEEWKIKSNPNFVDNSKVGSHSWIYILNPDDKSLADVYNTLPEPEKNIFNLIVNRILAVMNGEYIYESSELILNNGPHYFKIKGKIVKNLWYKEFYGNLGNNTNEKILPNLEKGDKVNLLKTESKEVKNKKPTRYSSGSLVEALDDLAVLLKDNKELSEKIRKISPKKSKGDRKLWLGTGWTRAEIIKQLEKNWFIKTVNWKLQVTNKWFKLVSIVDEKYKDPVTTGYWEVKLKEIEEWDYNYQSFIAELKKELKDIISQEKVINKNKDTLPFEPIMDKSVAVCPICGVGEMKFWDKWLSCSNTTCKFILWYNYLGYTFSDQELEDLVKWKVLKQIPLFSKKKNKEFKADLKLDTKEWKIKFV